MATCDGLLAMKSSELARQMMEQLQLLSREKKVWFEKRKAEASDRLMRIFYRREASRSWSL